MRPPVVTSHTIPVSGFLLFFSAYRAWRRRQSGAWSDGISGGRGPPGGAAPNPYGGSVTTLGALAEAHGGILCGLERIGSPRTVLCQEMAEPGRLASAGQARERGSTRPWVRLAPLGQEPAQGAKQRPGRGETKPRRSLAFRDAVTEDGAYAPYRRRPRVSSEAAGSPALLLAPWRPVARAKAVWRGRRE
jgi:hypothetical protein